jgi:hypothetical protein
MHIPPQYFETISKDLHAERIANAERQRFASAYVGESPTVRPTSDRPGYRRLACALRRIVSKSSDWHALVRP